MYHVTIYSRTTRGRPELCTPTTEAELLALVYKAGECSDGIIVQEFTSSDQCGEHLAEIWESGN